MNDHAVLHLGNVFRVRSACTPSSAGAWREMKSALGQQLVQLHIVHAHLLLDARDVVDVTRR